MKPHTKTRNSAISPARTAAFTVLLRIERENSYASELLHSAAYENLSARDHALATELVMGVLRWKSQLDDEIALFSSQPLRKLDPEILMALRLALYQFRHLDRIPKHAALNDSVELVKQARKRSAAPFVNAVLRKLSNAPPAPSPADNRQLLSIEILARTFAHPLWLVERWTREFGSAAAHKICEYDQTIPQTSIRLRTPAAEAELTKEESTKDAIKCAPGNFLTSARQVISGDITKTHAFRDGHIAIQDEGSQLVAALAVENAKAGTKILDCCAAPGGKTLAISDRNPQALIMAAELHPHRARLLKKLTGSSSASISIIAADASSLPTSVRFNRVLADVPCSGTGTLARNPEIKWRLRREDLLDLQSRQCAILQAAFAQCAPGGRVIYSTCSLEREENEDVIDKALRDGDSFRVVDCRTELELLRAAGGLVWNDLESLTRGPYLRTIPGLHPCDGFFAAILEKFAGDSA